MHPQVFTVPSTYSPLSRRVAAPPSFDLVDRGVMSHRRTLQLPWFRLHNVLFDTPIATLDDLPHFGIQLSDQHSGALSVCWFVLDQPSPLLGSFDNQIDHTLVIKRIAEELRTLEDKLGALVSPSLFSNPHSTWFPHTLGPGCYRGPGSGVVHAEQQPTKDELRQINLEVLAEQICKLAIREANRGRGDDLRVRHHLTLSQHRNNQCNLTGHISLGHGIDFIFGVPHNYGPGGVVHGTISLNGEAVPFFFDYELRGTKFAQVVPRKLLRDLLENEINRSAPVLRHLGFCVNPLVFDRPDMMLQNDYILHGLEEDEALRELQREEYRLMSLHTIPFGYMSKEFLATRTMRTVGELAAYTVADISAEIEAFVKGTNRDARSVESIFSALEVELAKMHLSFATPEVSVSDSTYRQTLAVERAEPRLVRDPRVDSLESLEVGPDAKRFLASYAAYYGVVTVGDLAVLAREQIWTDIIGERSIGRLPPETLTDTVLADLYVALAKLGLSFNDPALLASPVTRLRVDAQTREFLTQYDITIGYFVEITSVNLKEMIKHLHPDDVAKQNRINDDVVSTLARHGLKMGMVGTDKIARNFAERAESRYGPTNLGQMEAPTSDVLTMKHNPVHCLQVSQEATSFLKTYGEKTTIAALIECTKTYVQNDILLFLSNTTDLDIRKIKLQAEIILSEIQTALAKFGLSFAESAKS